MTNSSKVFLVVLILLIGGGYYAFQQWNAGAGDGTELASEPVTVTIPEGTGARDVAQLLEDNGVVRSASAFTASATIGGQASQIQAGTYELDPSSSTETILEVLTAGPTAADTYTITIPEGLTVEQTLNRMAEAEGSPFTVEQLREALALVALPEWVPPPDGGLPEGAEAFEGLLFPDTYEFTVEQPADEVLTRLITQTDAVLTEVGASTRNDLSLYQTLILGSLIEREARVAEERPVISSVIHNRIEDGMALQIDATVVYGIEVATGERRELVIDDYQFDTPWSTYVYPGLPPTPISGAGRSALEAAAAPAETGYYYYVLENQETGTHRFSETLAQHNQAIAEIRGG